MKIDLDLVGRKFGKLLVIKKSEIKRNRKTSWDCKCDCGNEITESSTSLLISGVHSCGCASIKDLSSKRFGKLIVISLAHINTYGAYWNCECDCGNKKIIRGSSLSRGDTQSCGCKRREAGEMRVLDLAGKTIWNWYIIKRVDRPSGIKSGVYWLCKCKCGTEKIVRGANITNGNSKSCGCFLKDKFFTKKDSANINRIFGSYQKGAKNKGLDFEIIIEDFEQIINENCFYCGATPNNIQKGGMGTTYLYNGIDRIDNNKGYIYGNIVPCCKECNIGKKAKTKEQFLSWVERIYNYSIRGVSNI